MRILNMFCEQCEQTASGQGCHQWGACGKSPQVNAIQDLLVYCLRGLAPLALAAKDQGLNTHDQDVFTCEALFATMTNVNFSSDRFKTYIQRVVQHRQHLQQCLPDRHDWPEICHYIPDFNESLSDQGEAISLRFLGEAEGNVDVFSLKLTVLYGLKGTASYAFHALELGQEDDRLYRFIHEALVALNRQDLSLGDWVALALKVGEMNLRGMELLDAGHTETFGHPVPTHVPLTPRPGKAILVSGHDIKVLSTLLEKTVNTEITVYTHGELLPAHGYPKLKDRYPHLYGHYGTAWQNQTKDFPKFPGSILVTTNCLMPPHEEYQNQLFTVGPVGYGGIQSLATTDQGIDFQPLIDQALAMPGFSLRSTQQEPRSVMVGFARHTVLGVADQILTAIDQKKIRHIFLVGGCDGAKPDRNYYTEFVEQVPQDCVVLTLACGKFRFFDRDLGTIGGLPRLMDVGQCNDAYSAIQIALGLAKALDVGVNDLPLSMILSWYEQKAVAVLLTLLYLGIHNIRLGPTLPAFLSSNVLNLLSEQYGLKAITTPEADLAACLG